MAVRGAPGKTARPTILSGKRGAGDTHRQELTLALDPQQFRAIFEEHAAFAWRVLARHGVREADLEDACQEVFLVVHARHADFEGRSSLRSWIYGIAVRVALNFRRKHARRREQLEETPRELAADAEQYDQLAQRQTLDRIERAVVGLDPIRREVFVLYELEGMTMAEVARALGVPENTALYRLYAARTELRARLHAEERAPYGAHSSHARRTAP